jgi:MFS family permease
MLTNSSSQLIFGRVYKFYSVKWVFLLAIGLFEVGSALCGAAPNSIALIIGRAIAGLGSSGIFSGAMMILVHTIPLHRRPLYSGLFSAVFGISSVVGPLLGGVFTVSY